MYDVKLSRQATKDREKLRAAGLGPKAGALIELLKEDPLINPPPYEKLVGNLAGYYSRRINIHHRTFGEKNHLNFSKVLQDALTDLYQHSRLS